MDDSSPLLLSNNNELDWDRVPALSVDDVLGDEQQAVLLKIDVEGHEIEAVESAKRALAEHRVKNVVLEFYPRRFGSVERAWTLLERFFAWNYTIAVLVHSQGAADAWVGRLNQSSFDELPQHHVLSPANAREWVVSMFDDRAGKDLWIFPWPKITV